MILSKILNIYYLDRTRPSNSSSVGIGVSTLVAISASSEVLSGGLSGVGDLFSLGLLHNDFQ